jgi:hypothetical protein
LFGPHLSEVHRSAVCRATHLGSQFATELASVRGDSQIPERAAVAHRATRFLTNICRHLLRFSGSLQQNLSRSHLTVVLEAEYLKIFLRMCTPLAYTFGLRRRVRATYKSNLWATVPGAY